MLGRGRRPIRKKNAGGGGGGGGGGQFISEEHFLRRGIYYQPAACWFFYAGGDAGGGGVCFRGRAHHNANSFFVGGVGGGFLSPARRRGGSCPRPAISRRGAAPNGRVGPATAPEAGKRGQRGPLLLRSLTHYDCPGNQDVVSCLDEPPRRDVGQLRIDRVIQVVSFHDADPGSVIHAAHDRGVGSVVRFW